MGLASDTGLASSAASAAVDGAVSPAATSRRANLNRRCLLLFANAESLSHALGTAPPEALHALAERARYSQHRLTPMELKPLEDYRRDCRERLEEKPPLLRFWNKYILLLY